IFTTVIGFKEEGFYIPEVEFLAKRMVPEPTQIDHAASLASNWARLATIPNRDKKIAIILSNYPNRDGRIGNGVGLDTPASTVKVLSSLSAAGYRVEPCPQNGEELMRWLQSGITNDRERSYGRPRCQEMDRKALQSFLGSLPPK